MKIIYSCPDCDGDLEPDGLNAMWCPACERAVTDPQLTGDAPDD